MSVVSMGLTWREVLSEDNRWKLAVKDTVRLEWLLEADSRKTEISVRFLLGLIVRDRGIGSNDRWKLCGRESGL